jgi:release factor glutamine methyltransferase
MTVLEALQWANGKLKKTGVDSPMLDAEILLAHVLNLSRAKLFSHFNDSLKQHHQERFLTLIDRRSAFEPIAYLIGKKTFYGRDFLTNPFVLIPRPSTETLIEATLELFQNIDDKDNTLIADIGTGSGAIAVTLAAEIHTPVLASDTSPRAISVAQKNAELLEVKELIDVRVGDLLTPLLELFETIRTNSKKPVSSIYPFKHLLICANLPYLTKNQMETLQKDVRDYEPREALEAGTDGLEAYWRLFRQLRKERPHLPRYVSILIEIDPSQTERAIKLIKHEFPDSHPQIKKDLAGLDRIVIVDV